ncbi:hypothetical protein KGM_207329 [Danaus plexippus plexippus]|uniref:Uncharacterized protein n=1 Tax=Danaus plexippus plexippus TaxID=278856 RepID=A0A212EHD9_DANPL|nr:hypothetical protein KGM_207329 [Danaus plexippus plexippus]
MSGRRMVVDAIVFSASFYVSYNLMSFFIERYRKKRIHTGYIERDVSQKRETICTRIGS